MEPDPSSDGEVDMSLDMLLNVCQSYMVDFDKMLVETGMSSAVKGDRLYGFLEKMRDRQGVRIRDMSMRYWCKGDDPTQPKTTYGCVRATKSSMVYMTISKHTCI